MHAWGWHVEWLWSWRALLIVGVPLVCLVAAVLFNRWAERVVEDMSNDGGFSDE